MADARAQREARRQKVLARSQAGHRPVVDLATQQTEIAPQGMTAVLDDASDADLQASVDGLLDAATPSAEDAGKSASRLAAERRRQKILSKSTERMAKVQGDRVIRREEDGGEEGVGHGGGGESLDDMLESAEAEFFGQHQEGAAGVAEAKPAAPQQAYFKSAKGGGGGGSSRDGPGGGSGAAEAAAQSKPGRQGAAGSGFKPARAEGAAPRASRSPPSAGAGSSSRRRPTGNKALESKHLDAAAIQSLSRAGGGVFGAKSAAADPVGRKRLLGGVRFWAGLEGVTKTALLLLAGAGVGGLLLPEARAAVAQAKFEAEHMRDFGDPRSRLELFLAGSDRGGAGAGQAAFDIDFGGSSSGSGSGDEFGDAEGLPPSQGASSSSMAVAGEGEAQTGVGEEELVGMGWADGVADGGADGGALSQLTDQFLSWMDCVVGWAHYLSTVSMPWGGSAGEISCVSAIYLALLVRLVVATVFSAVRVLLGLPAFPATPSASKPGMIMGMVLASVPTLGKLLAWGNLLKSIFSDTNLVVAGTVLTLALSLAVEEGAGPRRLAGSVSSLLGLVGEEGGVVDGNLKEL